MLLDIVKKGSTDRSVLVRVVDSTDGSPETGVAYNTAGVDLWYRREGAAVTSITEATLAALTTAHTDGGFLHVNNGYCRLDLPDAAFATGANHVDVGGTFTGMVVIGGRVRLVDYDPEDATGLGLSRLDAAVSGVAAAVWAVGTRTLTSFGTLAADVWASATRTLTAFSFGVTVTTNNDKTGYGLSAGAVQAIWDTLTSALSAANSIGKLLVDNINAAIGSRASQTSVDDLPTNAELATALGTADDAVLSAVGAVETKVDTIQAQTDQLAFTSGRVDAQVRGLDASVIDNNSLATNTAQEIADALLARNVAGGSDGGATVSAILQGKVDITLNDDLTFTIRSLDGSTTLASGTWSQGADAQISINVTS